MCTVLLAWRWGDDVPVVLAANRDELVARPSDPPLRLADDPPLYGGRDRVAGGTWLAVDPAGGRLCAVTNRRVGDRDPALRSRGELPLRVLTAGGDAGAAELLGRPLTAYNPVNVLYVSPSAAVWASPAGTHPLAPGVHVLGVEDLDDPGDPKTVRLLDRARAAAAAARDAADLRDRFAVLLASHETDPGGPPQSAACIHGDVYGTVSSSTVVVDAGGLALRFADGRPCVTPYTPVPLP